MTSYFAGDLITAIGTTTLNRLPMGTNGSFLRANSVGTNHVEWSPNYFEKTIGICESNSVVNYIFLVRQ